MKRLNKVSAAVIASTIAASGFVFPSIASAELSANIGVSNMYLWRGLNLSTDGGVVSGGIDYAAESGFYAGMWTTSESAEGNEDSSMNDGGHETDLYAGYAGEAGSISYDISYWHYLYPEDGEMSDTDLSELVLSVGTGPVSVAAYASVEDGGGDSWVYYTIGAEMGDFSATYGIWDDNSYSHLTASYAATDELSLSVSLAFEDEASVEEDPLFAVSYTKSFEIE